MLFDPTIQPPDDHTEKPVWLNKLGKVLQAQFSLFQRLDDIERAIDVHKKAVALTPESHLDKFDHLGCLGQAFQARFCHLGKLDDIQNAVSFMQQAVTLIPDGHADEWSSFEVVSMNTHHFQLSKMHL